MLTPEDRQKRAETYKTLQDRMTAATIIAIKSPTKENWERAAQHMEAVQSNILSIIAEIEANGVNLESSSV